MAVPGDCRNTVCISKSPGAVMGKQIHSKPYESLCESAQRVQLFCMYRISSVIARPVRRLVVAISTEFVVFRDCHSPSGFAMTEEVR